MDTMGKNTEIGAVLQMFLAPSGAVFALLQCVWDFSDNTAGSGGMREGLCHAVGGNPPEDLA